MKKSINKISIKNKGRTIYNFSLVVLTILIILGNIGFVEANNTKTMKILFEENKIKNQTKIINIPNVNKVNIKTIDNGSANAQITGKDKVTINVDNGIGKKVLIGGGYIPAETKQIYGYDYPTYNSGGFTGNLEKYLYSGSYTKGETKYVTINKKTRARICFMFNSSGRWTTVECTNKDPVVDIKITYNKDDYYGELNYIGSNPSTMCEIKPPIRPGRPQEIVELMFDDCMDSQYGGEVTKPEVDTRIWKYRGPVTKPESDTRIYETRYKYEVEIEYTENIKPSITILNDEVKIINEKGTIVISGTVTDPDSEKVTISASIGNISKSTTLTTPTDNQPWTLTWKGTELPEKIYDSITITANDGKGGTDIGKHSNKIIIDKTAPKINLIIK